MSFHRIHASSPTRTAYAGRVAIPAALLLMAFGWAAYIFLPSGTSSGPAGVGAPNRATADRGTVTTVDVSDVHP